MKKQLINEIANQLKSYGYTVYISNSGEHGFYTNGIRVVSFGGHWNFNVDFSGNYKTEWPKQCGTGWMIEEGKGLGSITKEQADKFISENAPNWATGGAKFTYTSPSEHLKAYGVSSGYKQF